MKIFGFIIAISLLILILIGIRSEHESEIRTWAKNKNMEVVSIDQHLTMIGTPFYYLNKGQYIYEVHMTDGQLWWVRTGLFWNDYEQEK